MLHRNVLLTCVICLAASACSSRVDPVEEPRSLEVLRLDSAYRNWGDVRAVTNIALESSSIEPVFECYRRQKIYFSGAQRRHYWELVKARYENRSDRLKIYDGAFGTRSHDGSPLELSVKIPDAIADRISTEIYQDLLLGTVSPKCVETMGQFVADVAFASFCHNRSDASAESLIELFPDWLSFDHELLHRTLQIVHSSKESTGTLSDVAVKQLETIILNPYDGSSLAPIAELVALSAITFHVGPLRSRRILVSDKLIRAHPLVVGRYLSDPLMFLDDESMRILCDRLNIVPEYSQDVLNQIDTGFHVQENEWDLSKLRTTLGLLLEVLNPDEPHEERSYRKLKRFALRR